MAVASVVVSDLNLVPASDWLRRERGGRRRRKEEEKIEEVRLTNGVCVCQKCTGCVVGFVGLAIGP